MTVVPHLRSPLPVIGHALAFNRDPVGLLSGGHRRFGEIFSFTLFGKRVFALIGPRGNEAFFRAGDDALGARDAYRFTVPIFGPGVAYDVEPALMDEQLQLLHPALRDDRMQRYAAVMAEESDAFLDGWGEAGEIDLLPALNRLTIFIAGRCLIGDAFRRRLSEEFAGLYHDLEGGINLVAFFNPYLPLPAMRRRDRARRRVAELIAGLVAERAAAPGAAEDFLATLMTARYSDGRALDNEAITGLILTLLFAGQHTSAVLAAWTGLFLARYPEHRERVRAESAPLGNRPSLAELKRLAHLERCMKEAERLRPPLVMLMRSVLKPFSCLGATLPAGALAMVSPAVSHRMGSVFAEPERFDPDRFGPGREEDRRTPYSLIGFGGGKHRCLGLAFAHQQVKVIWARILARFEIEPVGAEPEPDYTTFVVGPRPPCRIRYRRRQPVAPARLLEDALS
jgi:sterol 14-demethylase